MAFRRQSSEGAGIEDAAVAISSSAEQFPVELDLRAFRSSSIARTCRYHFAPCVFRARLRDPRRRRRTRGLKSIGFGATHPRFSPSREAHVRIWYRIDCDAIAADGRRSGLRYDGTSAT